MVLRIDPATFRVTHRREFDSPELILAMTATGDRVIAADRLGRIWIMRGRDLALEAEIVATTGAFTPQAMIVVDSMLLMTTHTGRGENGSVYTFSGWQDAVAGRR
jgi:hypothetical protein